MGNSVYIPHSWDYHTSITIDELEEYLSEEEYKKYKNEFLSVDVILKYNNEVGDEETGYLPSFDYLEWCSSISYPDSIVEAIDKRLKEFEDFYSEKAYEKLCDFIDYQKYGDF